MKVEYRIKPVTRYVITRWHEGENTGGVSGCGEYDNGEVAYHVAYALCKAEHDRSGEPVGSDNFIYPAIPAEVNVLPNGPNVF